MSMDAAYIAGRVASVISERGSTMTLRRRQGQTSTFTEITVKGTFKDVQPTEGVRMSEVPGESETNDSTATIAASHLAGWPVPPRKGDYLVYRGRTYAVLGAELKEVSNVPAAYILYMRGG